MMKKINTPGLVLLLLLVSTITVAWSLPPLSPMSAFQSPPPLSFLNEVEVLPTPRPSVLLVSNEVTVGEPNLTTSLNGYWPLDEPNIGPRHDSSPLGSNTLTNVNGVSWTTTGRLGNAADFEKDLNQYLKIDSFAAVGLNFYHSFTLMGWLKRESVGQNMVMVSKYDWGTNQRAYRLQLTDDNRLRLVVSPDGAIYSPDVYVTGGTQLQSTTVWYHVAAVFDAGAKQLRVYVNGELDAAQDVTYNTIYQSTAPFMVGANLENGQVSQPFDGQLDEWRVYNRALSQSEIQVAMGGLQGFWRLDETNTGPRLDSSPALSNTLTNVGGVGWSTAGVVGNASLLNNNAYTATQYLKIEDGQSSGLNFRNSFTLVGWLKRERLGEDMILVSKYEWGLSQRAYRLQLTPGDRLRLVVSPNGATYDSNVYLTGPTLLTSTTAWYHVAAVFDAANKRLKLYLNGNLEATKAVSYDMVFLSDAPFMLGANLVNTTAVQPFDGQLDEWRVYNRVLGKNEIQALMSE